MKQLILLRHAKSSWKDSSLNDHDRPLNKRGKKAAPLMGQRLAAKDKLPQLIISSTAKRALETAKHIARQINYPLADIKTMKSIYHASSMELIEIITHCNDKVDCLMLVGHNPTITQLSNQLLQASHQFNNIPTAGMLSININIEHWQAFSPDAQTELLDYDYPKLAPIINPVK
jgi:phosphohistidine phosphatase